jgi:hypothetical protein
MNSRDPLLRKYRAIYVAESCIRNVTFEALGCEEAKRLAVGWGFGLEGEVMEEEPQRTKGNVGAVEAFDVASACHIMGGISRTTLYRLLLRGKLERLPATRKVLVTRRSIERFCSQAA